MFKKLKDKLEEEFKQGPLKFPVSVQQLAQAISPSPSLNSLSDNNASSSVTYTSDPFNVSTDVFSIGDDDDSQDGSSKTLPLHSIDLTATSPSNMTQTRSRRSSLSSVTSEASSLFPIYENPSGQNYFQSDLESEMEDGMPSQLEKISKEQLYQSYKKVFNRYNKYKGRYVDLQRHYKELLHDNVKTKNVLQESQDKALRRIAELKEQCQLEQNAKAHLEESLRNDVEDRDHMINTLKTKISLLKGGSGNDGLLVDVGDGDGDKQGDSKGNAEEMEKLRLENENLQKEITDLKKLKETACHLIHRCDTTIEEATEDVNNENLKRKMSELKTEIQKMKTKNESLSHLLSRNVITEEDKKSQSSLDGNLLIDLTDSSHGDQKADEKDKKIEKLNNLLLKCKEKISSLTAEVKSKNLIIEDKNKRFKEVADELETNKKSVTSLKAEVQALRKREEENVLSVAENKLAIHKELETKEEQIRALTKELKTSENEFRKEKDDIIKKYEDKLKEMAEDFTRELRYKNEENEKLSENLNSISSSKGDSVKEWEEEFKKMLDIIKNGRSYENFLEVKAAEIEKAAFKLDERLSVMQKRLVDVIRTKQKELENSHRKVNELAEEREKIISETKAEHEGSLDKLNLEKTNLTKKVEELESALAETKNKYENEIQERAKALQEREKMEMDSAMMKEAIAALEAENTKMKMNCQSAETENKRLTEELCSQGERLKSAEGDSCLLEKANKEKTEAEKKLRDYIEDYKKLEKENQGLEKNLNQKCDKLMKDLNDSKEKIKSLENDNKAKSSEVEGLKKSLAEATAKYEELLNERQRLQTELEEAREKLRLTDSKREEMSELGDRYESAAGELASLKVEHSELIKQKSVIEEENARLKSELESSEERLRENSNKSAELENSLKEELVMKAKELEGVRDGFTSQVKALQEKLENEYVTNKELEQRVERMSVEKTGLEAQVAELNSKQQELESKLRNMESEYGESEKLRESEKDGLAKECERLKNELSTLAEKAKNWETISAENDKLKMELLESEKSKSELTEKIKDILNEKNNVSNSLEMKVTELEALKDSLSAAKEELAAKVTALEEEKVKLTSESENRLNVLKNEIKFMNNKFEEDIGNIEENRSVEVNQLNSRLEVAEKASGELLEKLERITTERDEAKVAVEERDLRIAEMESCMASLKAEMDQKFNQGKRDGSDRQQQEMATMITRYETELMKREEEIQSLRGQIHGDKHNSKRTNMELEDSKIAQEVEEVIERESAVVTTAEKELETGQDAEPDSVESLQKKMAQQASEMKELKKQYKREVTELRKIISMKRKNRRNSAESPDWGGTLDNDTEHEYLRNILYEYMMGREQLVLAKVLSAIVKFDKQQTRNVLEKEQHRQTLFGQLGIL